MRSLKRKRTEEGTEEVVHSSSQNVASNTDLLRHNVDPSSTLNGLTTSGHRSKRVLVRSDSAPEGSHGSDAGNNSGNNIMNNTTHHGGHKAIMGGNISNSNNTALSLLAPNSIKKRRTFDLDSEEYSCVRVVCRLRPMTKTETEKREMPVVTASPEKREITVCRGIGQRQVRSVFGRFDNVFGSYSTQSEIFESVLEPRLNDVLCGFEATVFAYGQTGTGKTYTMEGNNKLQPLTSQSTIPSLSASGQPMLLGQQGQKGRPEDDTILRHPSSVDESRNLDESAMLDQTLDQTMIDESRCAGAMMDHPRAESELDDFGQPIPREQGLIPRAARALFSRLSDSEKYIEYSVYCSYLEIYNEELSDLLVGGPNERTERGLPNMNTTSKTTTGNFGIPQNPTNGSVYEECGSPSDASSNNPFLQDFNFNSENPLPSPTSANPNIQNKNNYTVNSVHNSATSGTSHSNNTTQNRKKLSIYEDPRQGVVCKGLTERCVRNANEVLSLLKEAQERRKVSETMMNKASSRSHCLFTIKVNSKARVKTYGRTSDNARISSQQDNAGVNGRISSQQENAGVNGRISSEQDHRVDHRISDDGSDICAEGFLESNGKLHLVDLAGSEGAAKANNSNFLNHDFGISSSSSTSNPPTTIELERKNINRSLLTLGRVISELRGGKKNRIPYRDSKLTRLLQESLGGRCKTCVIATLSPSHLSLDETISTLYYAQAALGIQNRPVQSCAMRGFNNNSASSWKSSINSGLKTCDDWCAIEMRVHYLQSQLEEAEKMLAKKVQKEQELHTKVDQYLLQNRLLQTENTKKREELQEKTGWINALEVENQTLDGKLKDLSHLLESKERHLQVRINTEKNLREEAETLILTLGKQGKNLEDLYDKLLELAEISNKFREDTEKKKKAILDHQVTQVSKVEIPNIKNLIGKTVSMLNETKKGFCEIVVSSGSAASSSTNSNNTMASSTNFSTVASSSSPAANPHPSTSYNSTTSVSNPVRVIPVFNSPDAVGGGGHAGDRGGMPGTEKAATMPRTNSIPQNINGPSASSSASKNDMEISEPTSTLKLFKRTLPITPSEERPSEERPRGEIPTSVPGTAAPSAVGASQVQTVSHNGLLSLLTACIAGFGENTDLIIENVRYLEEVIEQLKKANVQKHLVLKNSLEKETLAIKSLEDEHERELKSNLESLMKNFFEKTQALLKNTKDEKEKLKSEILQTSREELFGNLKKSDDEIFGILTEQASTTSKEKVDTVLNRNKALELEYKSTAEKIDQISCQKMEKIDSGIESLHKHDLIKRRESSLLKLKSNLSQIGRDSPIGGSVETSFEIPPLENFKVQYSTELSRTSLSPSNGNQQSGNNAYPSSSQCDDLRSRNVFTELHLSHQGGPQVGSEGPHSTGPVKRTPKRAQTKQTKTPIQRKPFANIGNKMTDK